MGFSMLIGREHERRLLGDLMRQKKNVLILGDEGVGKSAIIEDMMARNVGENILYSKRSTTLKETLVNMVDSIRGGKNLQKKDVLSLKKICYQILDESPEYAVLDHIGWVERRFYSFLTFMKERKIPFIIVTRRPGKENLGHLWMGLYDFEKLEIKNLDQTKTSKLVDHYAASLDLEIDALSDFKKEVFKFSEGSPTIIRDLCQLAKADKYRTKGYVDVKLTDLDRRIKISIS
jgi:hypothetical protein